MTLTEWHPCEYLGDDITTPHIAFGALAQNSGIYNWNHCKEEFLSTALCSYTGGAPYFLLQIQHTYLGHEIVKNVASVMRGFENEFGMEPMFTTETIEHPECDDHHFILCSFNPQWAHTSIGYMLMITLCRNEIIEQHGGCGPDQEHLRSARQLIGLIRDYGIEILGGNGQMQRDKNYELVNFAYLLKEMRKFARDDRDTNPEQYFLPGGTYNGIYTVIRDIVMGRRPDTRYVARIGADKKWSKKRPM